MDIGRKDGVERLVNDANVHYGKIDILVCKRGAEASFAARPASLRSFIQKLGAA